VLTNNVTENYKHEHSNMNAMRCMCLLITSQSQVWLKVHLPPRFEHLKWQWTNSFERRNRLNDDMLENCMYNKNSRVQQRSNVKLYNCLREI